MILFDDYRVGWKCWRCGRRIMSACWLWSADGKRWQLIDINSHDDEETLDVKPFGLRCMQRMIESGAVDTRTRR